MAFADTRISRKTRRVLFSRSHYGVHGSIEAGEHRWAMGNGVMALWTVDFMVAAFPGCWSKVPFLWFGTLFHGETQSAVQAV